MNTMKNRATLATPGKVKIDRDHIIQAQLCDGQTVAVDWIHDLASSDSRLHKEQVIEKALMAANLGSANAQCFLLNAYQAYNPFFVFNVKQIPTTQGLVNRPNPWTKFWALCEALRTRSITGHAAKNRIQEISQEFDSTEWNDLASRVLLKDLKCGISEKTLNKVLGRTSWAIPVFDCQLAQDSSDQQSQLKGSKRLEVKLDGVRALTVINNGQVTVMSRNGREFRNFREIVRALDQHHKTFLQHSRPFEIRGSFVLDGEIVGASFQQLMRQAHRKTQAQTQDMVYYIFDIVPLDAFMQGSWMISQKQRTEFLEALAPRFQEVAEIKIMPGMTVDLDTSQGHETMDQFSKAAVAQGYEGIMIKNLEAGYRCKRSSDWLKYKPHIEVSLEVIALEEGTGRNRGRLGALVCRGEDSGRTISVNVGSGFSDSDRTDFYRAGDGIIGHVVEVRADAITQNQDGSYSLRFPRFLRFRGFDSGEKF